MRLCTHVKSDYDIFTQCCQAVLNLQMTVEAKEIRLVATIAVCVLPVLDAIRYSFEISRIRLKLALNAFGT